MADDIISIIIIWSWFKLFIVEVSIGICGGVAERLCARLQSGYTGVRIPSPPLLV
ncbi:protein of unknown function [Candidatus Nitrosocaldus cavascurensis]|uniref:Uncharacterized protein n=1 Tax=Candidatus Nitrosocaldus cavascurensis TaxID=2058097 RepID=A0A2K5AR44_9ARCH|nr:protein of unknown function [Candidatus Nitrosocaldus cavascurensis]